MINGFLGFKVDLTLEQMQQCLADSGCCICGQTATLVPADRIMYATRDITGTVDSANFVTGKNYRFSFYQFELSVLCGCI
jgi:thymidine phosphorylase